MLSREKEEDEILDQAIEKYMENQTLTTQSFTAKKQNWQKYQRKNQCASEKFIDEDDLQAIIKSQQKIKMRRKATMRQAKFDEILQEEQKKTALKQ